MNAIMEFLGGYINRAIYVWGGQGENVCAQTVNGKIDPEAWIRGKETTTTNANRVIALYRQRVADGVNPVIGVDCSGLVVEMLKAFGIIKTTADYNTKGLYTLCNSHPTVGLRIGDLVFYSKTGFPADISHVGIYVGDGFVVESKGRDYGVVKTEISDYPWNMFGRINALEPFTLEHPEPEYPAEPQSLAICKPVLSGAGYRVMQAALNYLGYTDDDGRMLDEDGKWGKRSRAAWNKAVRGNMGTVTASVNIRIDGIGEFKAKTEE